MTIYQPGLAATPVPPAVMLATVGALRGGAIALRCGADELTYADLDARSAALAGTLRARGVAQGDVVAVGLPRGIAHVVALVAAWRLGAAYLPLDPEWPDARMARLVARAGTRAVVASAARGARFAGTAQLIDPAAPAEGSAWIGVSATAADLAYVIYTSGSTGEPKGVEVTHANLAGLVEWHCDAFGVGEGTRAAWVAGVSFDASAWEIWPVLAAGGTLVIPDDETVRYDAARLADWLVAERVEIAFAPTAIAEQLIARDWPEGAALRTLLTGADRLKVRPRPGLPFVFVNNYGPTECTVVATSGVVGVTSAHPFGGLPTIGRPIAGVFMHILDDAGAACPVGVTGEIWIGGRQVARGYRGDPALTAERFVEHPEHGRLYRTGDLGAWTAADADGRREITFHGRADAQVKVRGHRIEPAEIEAALLRRAGVAACAVAIHGEELTAWIVPAHGHRLLASELRGDLSADLPGPMIPARFALIETLPLNSSGKVDRAALPDPAAHAMPETGTARAPSTPTEQRLAAIIGEVIGRGDIGVDDDFFLLGGHSLLGTQVIVKARAAFGVELSLLHLFEARTVAALSATIERLVIEMLETLSDEDIARLAAGGR